MIGPASDTGVGLVARARSCSVAAAISSKPSSGTPTSRRRPGNPKDTRRSSTASAAAIAASQSLIRAVSTPIAFAINA